MAKRMQTGTENFVRKVMIYLGDVDTIKSASDNDIWDELNNQLLENRSIEKDGRRKNFKKKEGDLADNFAVIMILNRELHQRFNLLNQQRKFDALNLALRNAAARNARRGSIRRTGNVIPIGLRPKSKPV